jgi:hypothetical protein
MSPALWGVGLVLLVCAVGGVIIFLNRSKTPAAAALQGAGAAPPPTPGAVAPGEPQFFLAVNGQPTGPIPLSHLRHLAKSGQLAPDAMLWNQGMPNWARADVVPGVFPDR